MIKGAASTKCDFIRTSHLYGSFVHQVNICSMFDDYLIKNRISKNIAIANWCWRTMSCGNEWKCKLSFLYINNLFDILESGKRNGPLWPMANRRISCNGLLSVIFESMAPIVQLAHTHTHIQSNKVVWSTLRVNISHLSVRSGSDLENWAILSGALPSYNNGNDEK